MKYKKIIFGLNQLALFAGTVNFPPNFKLRHQTHCKKYSSKTFVIFKFLYGFGSFQQKSKLGHPVQTPLIT